MSNNTLGGYAVGDIIRTKTGKLDAIITELHPRSSAEAIAKFDSPQSEWWKTTVQRTDAVTYRVIKDGKAWGPTRGAALDKIRMVRRAARTVQAPAPAPKPKPVKTPAVRGTQLTFDLTSTTTQEEAPMTPATPTARAEAFAAALTDRFSGETFSVMPGRKNHRIVKADKYGSGQSVHAFVDAEGNVYKAAGWKAPATGIRAQIRTDAELADLIASLTDQDWAGGYLYR